MFYRVKTVQPLPEYGLMVDFVNGERKRYDVRPLFDKWEAFRALRSIEGLFEQVRVEAAGYGISWNDDIDLACNDLYFDGVNAP